MKVLLTGGTGFLGKQILTLLIEDPKISRIDVVTRSKRSHPHSKVKIISADLSDPASMNQLPTDSDLVVHLAGLYDFTKDLPQNYSENVVSTLNVVERLKALNNSRAVPFLFASTYAVGFSSNMRLAEKPLTQISPRTNPYSYSKAVAERIFTDSGLPGAVFRLGVLVGDSQFGEFEKMDGPYPFLRFLKKFSEVKGSRWIKVLPIPGRPEGILPLVPVDYAARVFHRAVGMSRDGFFSQAPQPKIYGVYHSKSVSVEELVGFSLDSFAPWVRPKFISQMPSFLLKAEAFFTKIPESGFQFAIHPIELENSEFLRDFASLQIPIFDKFRDILFQGFLESAHE